MQLSNWSYQCALFIRSETILHGRLGVKNINIRHEPFYFSFCAIIILPVNSEVLHIFPFSIQKVLVIRNIVRTIYIYYDGIPPNSWLWCFCLLLKWNINTLRRNYLSVCYIYIYVYILDTMDSLISEKKHNNVTSLISFELNNLIWKTFKYQKYQSKMLIGIL